MNKRKLKMNKTKRNSLVLYASFITGEYEQKNNKKNKSENEQQEKGN